MPRSIPVIALKSDAVFDYWTDRTHPANAELRVLPEKLGLTLNGARTVRVQAVDSLNRPVAGITVVPWTIMKQGRTHYANLSGFSSQLDGTRTDARGMRRSIGFRSIHRSCRILDDI